MIAAWVGDNDLAFDQLTSAIHTPSGLTEETKQPVALK
jgi:hypothetical protein